MDWNWVEPAVKIRDARDRFAQKYAIDLEAHHAQRFHVKLGFLTIPFPNPRFLALHDLHHVVLDVPPNFWGEVEVSAFEIRSGPPTVLITLLCMGALFFGAILRPLSVMRWLRRYRGTRNLYRNVSYDALIGTDLDVLREQLGLRVVARE